MSNRYKGGVISATPPTTTGGDTGTASGAWTLEQQMQAQAAGLWPSPPPIPYIEDVFSTWLYTGNGATQTITNGINLSGKGGLVWVKARSQAYGHRLLDSNRSYRYLDSATTDAQNAGTNRISATSTGFLLDAGSAPAEMNNSGVTFASWTFRKQPKFFDVVTYTGNSTNRTIAHNLGSVPGTIIVKRTNTTGDWVVYHRSLGATKYVILNSTGAAGTYNGYWNDTEPTDTVFSLSGTSGDVNGTGNTYVAYLFAHNAGGFGATETDNVISCGSFTTDGSGNATVNLGYEPQWLMFKKSSASGAWNINDSMRGFTVRPTNSNYLFANSSDAELDGGQLFPTATGFTTVAGSIDSSTTFIYIAIRRGPMKTPTDATKVFQPALRTGTGATATVTGINFPPDLSILANRTIVNTRNFWDRLRGTGRYLGPNTVGAEENNATTVTSFNMNGISLGADTSNTANYPGSDFVNYYFQRAPGFFDEVCYTGTGSATTQTHNLGVVPELMIFKGRSNTQNWPVYTAAVGPSSALILNTTAAAAGNSNFNNTTPMASVFSIGGFAQTNEIANTYVAYLFATCPGVSKVGSYTGTGAAQTINCGFTAGSRFVMIKRTDSTGGWHVWDSARGIIPSNDPYLLLNTTDAETTGTDYVDTTSVGFEITSTAPAAINANGGTFVFLAIA